MDQPRAGGTAPQVRPRSRTLCRMNTQDNAAAARESAGERFAFGRRRRDRLIVLALSVALPLALGGAGGVITANAIPGWYAELAKPPWNPPSWLFGPVWTALYIAMGIAAWRTWRRGIEPGASPALRANVRGALLVYAGQLALNAIWTPVFFGLKRLDIALVIIAVLLLAIVETVRRFYRFDRPAAMLLLPYLACVSFATALNTSLWLLNR